MPSIHDNALDAALNYIDTNVTALHICFTQEPTTYAEATSTYTCGNKASPVVNAPVNGDTSGRKIVVDAITDGSVTATQTAGWWALVSGTELLAAGALSATQAVTNGNTFTLTTFDIEIQDPT